MLLLFVLVAAHVIIESESGGQFYVGLLRYSNQGNLNYTGGCCDGERQLGGECRDYCDLVFDVTIHGLHGSAITKRPSERTINTTNIIDFPSSYEGVRNPLSFQFHSWPTEVNITVSVYDKDGGVDELVDRFRTTFTHSVPTVFYIFHHLLGQRRNQPSSLDIIFRYKCDADGTDNCFGDCVDHNSTEICPLTSPLLVPTDVTYTGFADPLCENSEDNNCSIAFATSGTTEKFSNVDVTITPRASGEPPSPVTSTRTQPTAGDSSITTITHTTNTTTIPSTPTFSSTTLETVEINVIPRVGVRTAPRSQVVFTAIPSTGKASGTTPHRVEMAGDGVGYWPAILGGALGGLALLVAVAIVVYYKRQKKLEKRQEIYNVNPKIIWKVECEENGTSGRGDVALETEQV